jgi:hypothetical protein
MNELTDIELCLKFAEECRDFISPSLLRDIEHRGLYSIINYLPSNIEEAKKVVKMRLTERGLYNENDKTVEIFALLKRYKTELDKTVATDTHRMLPLLLKMTTLIHTLNNLSDDKNSKNTDMGK